MSTKIYVNLSVKDLDKTTEFFTKLGFKFNPQFTDRNSTAMIVGEDIVVMLLVENYFRTFTNKDICDTKTNSEVILAFTTESREKVDQMMSKVMEAGGTEYREPENYGWMYGRSFQDIDGHLWEIFYMDESAISQPRKV